MIPIANDDLTSRRFPRTRRSGTYPLVPIVAFLVLICSHGAEAQVAVDTARGIVGKTISLGFHYDRDDTMQAGELRTFSAELLLTRPTVFYPQSLTAGGTTRVTASEIIQRTDSSYTFSVTFSAEEFIDRGDTLFRLNGEALAGSDSVTDLVMTDVLYGGEEHRDLAGTLLVSSVGSRLPYVRFATLNPGRPNPTETGRRVQWGYRIDKRTEVLFRIYDMVGRLVNEHDYGILDQGIYIHSFTPGDAFPSGMFIVRLITNSGEDYEIMHVLR